MGVVADYHFKSLKEAITPMMLFHDDTPDWVVVKTDTKDVEAVSKPDNFVYIYMHCEFDEESIQAHNVAAIRQEVMEDELECWPSKLQDIESSVM